MTPAEKTTVAWRIALAAMLVLGLGGLGHAQTGTGTALVNEPFSNSTVSDPNFTVQGRTCLTGANAPPPAGSANIPQCPASQTGPVPPRGVVPGYLQFTDAANNEAGSTLYNRPIPSSAGVVATFEQWQYGGNGADGISFFLVDGATTLTATGGLGGSLGYAQRFTTEPGVKGAYLGIGFDAFGNFYNDGENRGTGCAMLPPFLPNQSTTVKDVITLRGPGNGGTGYCWLGSTTTMTTPPVSNLGGSLRASTLAAGRRSIALTISPAPSPRVTVSIDFFDGRGPRTVLDIPAPPNPPATYKFGWSGSTGGQNDIHLIRNVAVKTVVPLNQLNLVKQIDRTNPLPNPIVVGSVIPYQFILTNTGLQTLTGLTVTDPTVTGLTCPTDRIDPAPAPTSTVVCRGSHVITQADLDAGQLVNTATSTAVDPASNQIASNPSTVTLPLGTTPRVGLQKFVDTPGPYFVGQSIAYRYNVSNVGTVTLNNPAVTDDKGFPVTCAPPTTLVPGGAFNSSTTCTGTYVIRAADINPTTGLITNTATATAQPTTGGSVTSAPASQTIPVGVDIAVTKTVDNASPILGQIVTFTVTAINNGPGNATGLTLSDLIPPALFSSAVPSLGTSYDAMSGVWTIGNLPSGQSQTLQISVQAGLTPFTNVASVATLTQPDIDPSNNSAQSTITPRSNANLDVEKTVDNATPAVDQQITFTITLRNLGPSPAVAAVVNDLLPTGLSFVSAIPSQGTYDPVAGVWTVGSLPVSPPPATPATLLITALVTQPGTFPNTATATATNDPAGDSSSATVTANRIGDLVIGKSDGLTSVLAGTSLTYTIVVSNLGPTNVVGATVTDTFPGPALLQNVSWTCATTVGTATCGTAGGTADIATTVNLPVGAAVTFTVTATVNPAATGTLTNTATVTPPAGTTDPNPGNDTSTDNTTITPSADVTLTKTLTAPAPPAIAAPGQDVMFALLVTNQGPSTATNVVVTDPPVTGLDFVSSDVCAAFPCMLGDLAPNASRTINVTFHIPSNLTRLLITNVATATSPTPDPVPGNNTGQASVSLGAPIVNLSVTKDDRTTTVVPGRQTTYTIVVSNSGPSDVVGASVTDNPPATLTNVTWTCTAVQPNACGQPNGTGAIATTVSIVSGGSVTFSLTGTVAPDATGKLINRVVAQVPPGVVDPTPSEATDTDTITPMADVAITKTGPPVIVPGNNLVYTLEVRNLGPSTAVQVAVSDATPTGLDLVSVSGACNAFPCVVGDIPPNDPPRIVTVTFAVPLGYTTPAPIENTALVTSATPDPNTSNNTSTIRTPVNTAADIAVTKTVTPATASAGDTVTFTVTATNNGPNQASGVVITDVLPAGLSLVSFSPAQGSYVASQGTWTVGTLANGASTQLTLVARVAHSGTITNFATKTAENEVDPNPDNDSGTATINPTTPPPADVGLLKTVDNPTPSVGNPVTFTVTATNFGPGNATGVVVTDLLPAGLALQSAGPSQGAYDQATGLWTVGDIANGASATLTLAAQVTASGPLVNAVRKTAQTEPDPNPANDRASAVVNGAGTASVSVAKSVSNSMPAVGESVTFVVTLHNLGPEPATDIVVNDVLPPSFTLTASVASLGTFDTGTGLWTIPTLAVSQSAVLILTGTIDQPGQFTNTATKTGQTPPDPDPTDNTGTATGDAGLVADLSITKTDDLDTAFGGQVITYTITVANAGPSPVSSAPVHDTFPPDLTAVTWTCTASPGAVCQSTLGAGPIDAFVNLPVGGTAVFTASGTLSPDVAGTVVNTATVQPPAGVVDPNLANNTATDRTNVTLQADLAMEKTGPASAASGTTVTYNLVASNLGPSTATDVVVTDPTPAGLASPVVSDPCAGGFPCNLGSLRPGAQVTIIVTYTVVATGGTVTNTATVMSPIPDPNPDQNTSSVTTTITPAPTPTIVTTSTTIASTTSTPVTTTTSTTSGNEICGNCVDDDQNGLVDYEDPACCPQMGALKVTKVRVTARNGNTSNAKLRITGTLEGGGFASVDPRTTDVSIRLADGSSGPACCTITQVYWQRLFRKHFGFWDQRARICPPVTCMQFAQRSGGSAIWIISRHFDLNQLVGPTLKITVRAGDTCATSTVTLRPKKTSGAAVFP